MRDGVRERETGNLDVSGTTLVDLDVLPTWHTRINAYLTISFALLNEARHPGVSCSTLS